MIVLIMLAAWFGAAILTAAAWFCGHLLVACAPASRPRHPEATR